MRSRISPAALFVNVTARTADGGTPRDKRYAMRAVITRVLPVPAPASTSSGPSVVVTASRWAGFRDWSRSPMLDTVAFGVGGGSSVGRVKAASYTTARGDESVCTARVQPLVTQQVRPVGP